MYEIIGILGNKNDNNSNGKTTVSFTDHSNEFCLDYYCFRVISPSGRFNSCFPIIRVNQSSASYTFYKMIQTTDTSQTLIDAIASTDSYGGIF